MILIFFNVLLHTFSRTLQRDPAHLPAGVRNLFAVRSFFVALRLIGVTSCWFLALDDDPAPQLGWRRKPRVALPERFAVQPVAEDVADEVRHAHLLLRGGVVFERQDHRLIVVGEGAVVDCAEYVAERDLGRHGEAADADAVEENRFSVVSVPDVEFDAAAALQQKCSFGYFAFLLFILFYLFTCLYLFFCVALGPATRTAGIHG